MRRLSVLLALLLVAKLNSAETHVPEGPVSGTWTPAGSPYLIEGNIIVEGSASLVIEPGVTVIQYPSYRIRIEGQLLAIGTVDDSIYFLAADTGIGSEGLHFLNTNYSPRDSSKLIFCDISHGVASGQPDPYMHGGGIYAKNSSRLLISHCYIHHCRTVNVFGANGANGSGGYPNGNPGLPGGAMTAGGGGAVYFESCNPALTYCTIAYNHTGDSYGGSGGNGAAVSDTSGSDLHGGAGGAGGVATGGRGGAICLKNSNAVIQNNVIHHNYTGNGYAGAGGAGGNVLANINAYGGVGGSGGVGYGGDGGAIYVENSTAQMDVNLIFANKAGSGNGGHGGNGGTATASQPGTAFPGNGGDGGNGYGGDAYAIYALTSPQTGVRLTTITNHAVLSIGVGGTGGLSGGGVQGPSGQGYAGLNIIGGAALLLTNSVVWNNADPSIDSSVTVSYSDIQGGHTGIGNIALDPLFTNPAQNLFYLAQTAAGQHQNSPCLNAGNPATFMIIGTTRTDGVQDAGIVDMGYHYTLASMQPVLDVTLTPLNPPIVIPAQGGSFNFDAAIVNNGSQAQFAVWTRIRNPDGSYTSPSMGPVTINPPAGFTITRQRTQNVPGSWPPGVYTYLGYANTGFTYPAMDSSFFTFTKSAMAGSGPIVTNWACTGEPFPGERSQTAFIPSGLDLGVLPNPFNPITALSYELRAASYVSLRVYDTTGRLVLTLVDGAEEAGQHSVTFDGSKLASGIYLVYLEAGNFHTTSKMLLLK